MDLSFLEQEAGSVEHKVCGKTFRFYAASVPGMYLLKNFSRPVLQALSSIFGGIGRETGLNERTQSKSDGSIATSSEITAIAPELAKLKIDTRDRSIGLLMDTLLDEKNGKVIAEIIADSLQEEWKRGDDGSFSQNDKKAIYAMWGKINVPAAVGFLTGVALANKATFDPLVERLRGPNPVPASSQSPTGPAAQASPPPLEQPVQEAQTET